MFNGSKYAAWRLQVPFERVTITRTTASQRRKAAAGQVWLLVERYGEKQPSYYLSNLPAESKLRRLVTMAQKIQRGEQANRELKDMVGFDHFEGRRWRGWHHHVTMAIAAYAFWVVYQSKSS